MRSIQCTVAIMSLQDRNYPIEFAEVASMSMELLTQPYWDEFYDSKETSDRARKMHLEAIIGLLAGG